MTCHALTHKISDADNNLSVSTIKDFWSWSHMSAGTTDGNYLKIIWPVRPKTAMSKKRRRRNKNSIKMLERLHANTKKKKKAKTIALNANAITF